MRHDLHYVIVERARRQPYDRGRRSDLPRRLHDLYDVPVGGKVGMKHGLRDTKDLNENLNPLVRWLRTNCGRPWADVWSELSKAFRSTGTVTDHVRNHVVDYVHTHTFARDGRVWYEPGGRGFQSGGTAAPVDDVRGYHAFFYVHPHTGALCHVPYARIRWVRPDCKTLHVLGPRRVMVKRDGTWFVVELAELPPTTYVEVERAGLFTKRVRRVCEARYAEVRDAVLKAPVSRQHGDALEALYGRRDVYGVSQRTASKKDLRAVK